VEFFFGSGDLMEKRTPYYAWRSIFEQIISGFRKIYKHLLHEEYIWNLYYPKELRAWVIIKCHMFSFPETSCHDANDTRKSCKKSTRLLVAILGETAEK